MFYTPKDASSTQSCPTAAESTSSSELMMMISIPCSASFHEQVRGILIVPTQEESLDEEITNVLRREAQERRDEKFEKAMVEHQGVTFRDIIIREYPMTVGDNPSVSSGPPLAIDWNHIHEVTLSLDSYEESKPVPRNGREMIVPRAKREQIFRDAGFSYNQLIRLTKPVNVARLQRRKTNASLGLSPWLELCERASRKAKNAITLGKKKREEKAFLKPWMQGPFPLAVEKYVDNSNSKRTSTMSDVMEYEQMPESLLIQS